MPNLGEIENFCAGQISDGFFSGIQIACLDVKRGHRFDFSLGTISFDSPTLITAPTLFDLASLTKPLCTLAICAYYGIYGKIDLSKPISTILPAARHSIPILSLLNHHSGLPAYEPYFSHMDASGDYPLKKNRILNHISATNPNHPPIYSDINYILLGFMLEEIFQERLNIIYQRFLRDIGYACPCPMFITEPIDLQSVAATRFSPIRNRMTQGEVEDENAWLLDGIAGHAGLFGTARNTADYLAFLMTQDWFCPLIENGVGFDIPNSDDSAYGQHPKPSYRGHLGFTGTAMLLDYDAERVFVILTNRTHPSEDKFRAEDKSRAKERIRYVRRFLFDRLYGI